RRGARPRGPPPYAPGVAGAVPRPRGSAHGPGAARRPGSSRTVRSPPRSDPPARLPGPGRAASARPRSLEASHLLDGHGPTTTLTSDVRVGRRRWPWGNWRGGTMARRSGIAFYVGFAAGVSVVLARVVGRGVRKLL